MSRLSELEGVVLGLFWQDGPCTPYVVRQVFVRTPSPQWSGSAGAIYPAVRRLEARRSITSAAHAHGLRRSRRYRLTPTGTAALKRWLLASGGEWVAGVPPDPMRTRCRFLAVLPPAQTRAVVAEWRAQMAQHLAVVTRDARARKAGGNRLAYLIARGALLQLRARRAWLSEVASAVDADDRTRAGRRSHR